MSQRVVGQYLVQYLAAQTSNSTLTLPAGYRIESIDINETAGHAITGGLKIGTTNGGTDVVAAQTVGASGIVTVSDATLLKHFISEAGDTTLYIQAVSAWNSASINIYIKMARLTP